MAHKYTFFNLFNIEISRSFVFPSYINEVIKLNPFEALQSNNQMAENENFTVNVF